MTAPALTLNPPVLRTPAWWHWLITAGLIAMHYTVWPDAVVVARVLCVLMLVARLYTDRRPTRRVQVYACFLLLLFMGEVPGLGWYYYTMLAGTLLNCLVGYCPLDRMLQALPFNAGRPFGLPVLRDAVLGNLFVGGLIERRGVEAIGAAGGPACMVSPATRPSHAGS